MIASWMGFAMAVTAACALAAWSVDRVLRDQDRPRRFVWLGAILVPAIILGARALAPLLGSPEIVVPETVVMLEGLRIPVASEAQRAWLDPVLVGLWVVGSTGLLLIAFASWVVLRRRMRSWEPARIGAVRVLVSETTGPAVVGVLTPTIVLPRWGLEGADVGTIVAHELEHVRAGDNRLLAIAHLAVAAAPWNVPLWWIVQRLRRSIESDCDRRVLRSGAVDTRTYCELLLAVGGSRRVRLHPMAALSEPRSLLEERIDQMTRSRFALKAPMVLTLVLLATSALALACSLPGLDAKSPTAPSEGTVDARGSEPLPGAATPVRSLEELRTGGPTFTPFTVRPDLKNREAVARALSEEYPALLRDAGVTGTTNVWFLIGDDGSVLDARVQEPSDHPALDQAALRVATRMEFTPALNQDRPVPVWVAFPITFQTADAAADADRQSYVRGRGADGPTPGEGIERRRDGSAASEAERVRDGAAPSADRDAATGGAVDTENMSFTPFTRPPVMRNPARVSEALEAEYPPLLRDAGVTGTVTVWFFVDAEGVAQRLQIQESSGHEALDQAALAVAATAEFEPALNGEDPVAVWIAFPISFGLR